MRIIKGSSVVLDSPVFVASDGETPTDCSSTPTCSVTRADGTSLTAAVVSDASGNGRYTAAITTTHTSRVDVLTVVWTGAVSGYTQVYTTELEVAGGHYATIPQLRAEPGLEDPGKVSTAELREVLSLYEDLVEDVTGVAWVRRYARISVGGFGNSAVLLRRTFPEPAPLPTVIAVTVEGVAQTTADFGVSRDGLLVWNAGYFPIPGTTYSPYNVTLDLEHGYQSPPPALAREVRKAVRYELLSRHSDLPSNQISQTFDGLTIRYSTPDPKNGRPTGILSLDAVLNLPGIMHRIPGIA